MSMTAEEFDKAIKLNDEIEEIEGCMRKLENPRAVSFVLTWGNMESFMNEQVAIPQDIEEEIVLKIYEWYKNRLKQAEDELSELVTKE